MRPRQPTKEDILAELRRIQARDGEVSGPKFKKETGWDRHWFDKYWPLGGYQEACDEAGAKRGAIIGVETNLRVTDEQLAVAFADVVEQLGRIPSLNRFKAVTRMAYETFVRGDSWSTAKSRVINVYFGLPQHKRKGDTVDALLKEELAKLGGVVANGERPPALAKLDIRVPSSFIAQVQDFGGRGEEEKRQLVAQFFYEVLGYKRARVHSEFKKIDVLVNDRRDHPWLIVEVKPSLDSNEKRRQARRQGFDYAHRLGMRFVVISDADFYEIFDRYDGNRLRYDEMRQGSFHLSALRSRDSDLLSMLAAER